MSDVPTSFLPLKNQMKIHKPLNFKHNIEFLRIFIILWTILLCFFLESLRLPKNIPYIGNKISILHTQFLYVPSIHYHFLKVYLLPNEPIPNLARNITISIVVYISLNVEFAILIRRELTILERRILAIYDSIRNIKQLLYLKPFFANISRYY
jgi:hypothetical protein